MAIARPDSDVSQGNWSASTGSDLFAMIDESTSNDTDFIQLAGSQGLSTCRFSLSNIVDPATDLGHVIRFRAKKSAAGGDGRRVSVNFYDTTVGVSPLYSSVVFTDEIWTDYEMDLSEIEAASITNYNTLELSITGSTNPNNSSPRDILLSHLEFDAGGGTAGGAFLPILKQLMA